MILLGGFVSLGKRMEHRPLFVSAVYKAAFFAVLVAAFHWIEEFVKDAIHDHSFAETLHDTLQGTSWPLLGLMVICFCLFIPFFCSVGDPASHGRRRVQRTLPAQDKAQGHGLALNEID